MDFDELRKIRDDAIVEMQDLLDRTKPTELPQWAILCVVVPIYLTTAINMTLRMLWSLIKGWAQSPFMFARIWADVMVIMYWFFSSSAERMRRK